MIALGIVWLALSVAFGALAVLQASRGNVPWVVVDACATMIFAVIGTWAIKEGLR